MTEYPEIILLDCQKYKNAEIREIVTSWIQYIDKVENKTRRPLFMRLLWLADGASFTAEDMARMRAGVDALDANKAEVRKVKEWIGK